MLRVDDTPYQSTSTNPYRCRGPELLTPPETEHTATGKRTRLAVHDDADPLTWWHLCEDCAKALGYIW